MAPDEWFGDRSKSSIWIRLYTSLMIPHSKFEKEVSNLFSSKKGNDLSASLQVTNIPIALAFGKINNMKVHSIVSNYPIAGESGEIIVPTKIEERKLEETNYFFLIAPLDVDGVKGSEFASRKALDVAAGIICLHAGLNLMRDIAFEGELGAQSGDVKIYGNAIKVPKPPEGPFLAQQNGEDILEISESIKKLSGEKKSQIMLSIQLMDSGMRKNNGFFEYWTALEVVCKGSAPKIRNTISKIYQIKQHEVEKLTGFGQLKKWRHDYIHKGIEPNLSADIERYIQLLFLDLLRFEIKLPIRGHVNGIQNAVGYDLSTIGLPSKKVVN
jgi:hypothetical protein